MRHNLSEIFEVIKDRRTIYPELYSTRKVHKEIIEKLLNAATWAPTHGKTQPWRFTVFQSEESRKELANFLVESYKHATPEEKRSEAKLLKMENRPMASTAVIGVCMERQESERIPEIEEIMAVACAVQNMQLMATAYGIGAFWSTPKFLLGDAGKQFFNLAEKDRCLGLIYLGYPKDEWPKGQRKPIEYLSTWK
ncbi:nitroreductase family protein [Luteibaculum oceani]|uniref:Putative NAD(P)H nitroreductase n=1 Tax=Luteibaculum oceani TaxID=1294296 RepID=A0A5C6UQU6_9FLAO|nr:nitroreductase [Luteibaculum oceani]TXC75577.1 nitroreductase [Luteibaculum oceani]